jgi:nicotinamidase-related amidase
LDELSGYEVNYSRSAVIVYNMQVGNPNANVFGKIIPNIKKIIEAARESGKPVIYGQQTMLSPDYQNRFTKFLYQRFSMTSATSDQPRKGQILEEIAPAENEVLIKKSYEDFFIGTNLEQLLNARMIETVIFVGAQTERGIDTTAKHAWAIGLVPVIVEDAVGSRNSELQDAVLKIMRSYPFSVQNTDNVVKKLAE